MATGSGKRWNGNQRFAWETGWDGRDGALVGHRLACPVYVVACIMLVTVTYYTHAKTIEGQLTFDLRNSVNNSPPGTKSMTM